LAGRNNVRRSEAKKDSHELIIFEILFSLTIMLRPFFKLLFLLLTGSVCAQQHSVGLGIHSGFTIPVAIDKGMDSDPRYSKQYTIKAAPIGVTFMKDFTGFGFVLSPGIAVIGQNYAVVNTEGGHIGKREIDLSYFQVPFAFKLHLIDLDFFRVSALAFVNAGLLYNAKDRISHETGKMFFPEETYPHLPDSYSVQFDGVAVPDVRRMSLSGNEQYNKIQLFAGAGLRSDWDVSNHWRVSVDFRVNYGLMETRTTEHTSLISEYRSIYDSPGKRKDLFAHFSIGIGRFIDFDKSDKEREKKLKGTRRVYVPQKQSGTRTPSRRK
jgi:hypothetical protein